MKVLREKKTLNIVLALAVCLLWQEKAKAEEIKPDKINNNVIEITESGKYKITNKEDSTYNKEGTYTKEDDIYGGRSKTEASKNIIDITGTKDTNINSISGGWANNKVEGNNVNIKGIGQITAGVWGGCSSKGIAINNKVDIEGNKDSVIRVVAGGVGNNLAEGNKVRIKGVGQITTVVWGGDALKGIAKNNEVNIEGNKDNEIYKVYGGEGLYKSEGNRVNIKGGVKITKWLYGGNSNFGTAINNDVNIEGNKDSKINRVYGGNGRFKSEGNRVNIKGVDKITADVYGGKSSHGIAIKNVLNIEGSKDSDIIAATGGAGHTKSEGNRVNIKGVGNIQGGVYGGYSLGIAKNNEVKIFDTNIERKLIGGIGKKEATGNMISIGGKSDLSNVRVTGGEYKDGWKYSDLTKLNPKHTKGNILNIGLDLDGKPAAWESKENNSIRELGNFETINFHGVKWSTEVPALTIKEETNLSQTTINAENIVFTNLSELLSIKEAMTLINTNGHDNKIDENKIKYGKYKVGTGLEGSGYAFLDGYNVKYEIAKVEKIDFDTEYIGDDTLENGVRKVETKGEKGIIVNGMQKSTPTTQVVIVGTKPEVTTEIIKDSNGKKHKFITTKTYKLDNKTGILDEKTVTETELVGIDKIEKIKYKTKYIADENLEKGEQVVVTKGEEGQKINGKVTKEVTDKVIKVGTKPEVSTETIKDSNGKEHEVVVTTTYKINPENGAVIVKKVYRELDSESITPGIIVREQTHNVVVGNMAGFSAINAGQDYINSGLNSIASEGMAVYMTSGGSSEKYKTGSHVKTNAWNAVVGVGSKTGNLSYMAFYEYGNGHYDAYSEVGKGKGDIKYQGAALGTKYQTNNNIYGEITFRIGKVKNNAKDVLSDGFGHTYSYETESRYYGINLGLGKIFDLTETAKLDTYGKYFYTHMAGDDFVAGGQYKLDDVKSRILRLGLKMQHDMDKFGLYYGLACDHEFAGEAKGTVDGFEIKSSDIDGTSLMTEIGVTLNPYGGFKFDLGVKGYAGKHRGYRGTVGMTYTF